MKCWFADIADVKQKQKRVLFLIAAHSCRSSAWINVGWFLKSWLRLY